MPDLIEVHSEKLKILIFFLASFIIHLEKEMLNKSREKERRLYRLFVKDEHLIIDFLKFIFKFALAYVMMVPAFNYFKLFNIHNRVIQNIFAKTWCFI